VGASILICDDEKNIRRTLGMVLEGLGHRVHEAASAPAKPADAPSGAAQERKP